MGLVSRSKLGDDGGRNSIEGTQDDVKATYCKSGNFRVQLFSRFADFELFHLFLNPRF